MKATEHTFSWGNKTFRLHLAETDKENARARACVDGIWLEQPWLPDDQPGWVEFAGGERPVPAAARVQILLRGEREEREFPGIAGDLQSDGMLAANVFWKHTDSDLDVVAYRVISAAPASHGPEAGAQSSLQPSAGETTKPSNPKDMIGIRKTPFSCVPMNVVAEMGVGMLEGASKYGRHNFRAVGVRSSVYFDAVLRHLIAWWEGEDLDPDTDVHHVAKALTCLAVLRDAQLQGLCTDDRPPRSRPFFPELNDKAASILDRHADKSPRHYTIEDSQ